MATTEYGVNHPMAVKHWSADLMKEALKRTYALQFMSKKKGSLIQIKTELNKAAGDRIRFGLRMQLQGDSGTRFAARAKCPSSASRSQFARKLATAWLTGGRIALIPPFSINSAVTPTKRIRGLPDPRRRSRPTAIT